MWLLRCDDYQLCSFEGDNIPQYAILSHRWGEQETTFKVVMKGRQKDNDGWKKIQGCCEQAKRDGYSYIWADTCCIDKRSSAELSEAINSMYKWYQGSRVCYAYLSDVTWSGACHFEDLQKNAAVENGTLHNPDHEFQDLVCRINGCGTTFKFDFLMKDHLNKKHGETRVKMCDLCRNCFIGTDHYRRHLQAHESLREREAMIFSTCWFTRGWTLQELLAPREVVFFDCQWRRLGTRHDFCESIKARTKIPLGALLPSDSGQKARKYCIAEKMSWAAERHTSRVEDRAYSLLGIFGINMPLLYGEGEGAFHRLQEELVRTSDDASIFAWSRHRPLPAQLNKVLAQSPECFKSLEDPAVFQSVPRGFSLTKGSLNGNFPLWRHHRHIFAAILGYMNFRWNSRSSDISVIVMYLIRVSNNEYRRVIWRDGPYGTYVFRIPQKAWNLLPRFPLLILPLEAELYTETDVKFPMMSQGIDHRYCVAIAGMIKTPSLIKRVIPPDGLEPWHANVVDFSRWMQADLGASYDDELFIHKGSRVSGLCIVLNGTPGLLDNEALVVLFGHNLIHEPTVWFANIEYLGGQERLEIDHGIKVDINTKQRKVSYPGHIRLLATDKSVSSPVRPESITHVARIDFHGFHIDIQFVIVPQGHRVFLYCAMKEILGQLPRQWVSSHPSPAKFGSKS